MCKSHLCACSVCVSQQEKCLVASCTLWKESWDEVSALCHKSAFHLSELTGQTCWSVNTYLSYSCPGGPLRPFRKAFHPSRSFTDVVVPLHDCHLISSRSLSALLLQVIRGLPPSFFCLLVSKSVQFCRCYCHSIHPHLRIFTFTDSDSVRKWSVPI